MKNLSAVGLAVAVVTGLSLAAAGASAADIPVEKVGRLPSYNVDVAQSSVSGLSSGAYMTVQFHVAYSGTLVGAGVIAGGPYHCSKGSWARAMKQCMDPVIGLPDPKDSLKAAREAEDGKKIDNLSNLSRSKVYIFGGLADKTVKPPVVDTARQFYRLAGVPEDNIKYVGTMNAGHGFATTDIGNECPLTKEPYLNDCDYDQAGDILQHIYGPLNPPNDAPTGTVVAFDQGDFIDNPSKHSMDDTGYAYVPAACAANQPCKVHVAFHGCHQGASVIGNQYYTRTGYNRWADGNGIIVLYPQVKPMTSLPRPAKAGGMSSPGNPNGCWDWFAYDSDDFANKKGPQMAAVKGMLDRLAGQR